jgi:large subunit ribosomal protein L13
MRTFSAKPQDVQREWLVFDAKDQAIGRLASKIAKILQGKHKPTYTPHIDMGDAVIVLNAAVVKATGNKDATKQYYHHTGYPGGIKSITLGKLRAKNPTQILELAVKRMLPRGPLGRDMFRKLHVYAGAEHPHTAQQPRVIEN